MNVGYVRLSRDDDKRNYVSIENQKLVIQQYAKKQHLTIDRWYEDDGFSGYKFDRPGFCQLMADLKKDVDTVFVKDFSRLGRHNAKVLLLLDEFQESRKHLIVIDDHYDSYHSEDDTIGIKTWYNERYIKDTSKKIRRAIGARQEEGTLMIKPPFGYTRNEQNRELIEIVPKEAEYIRRIYNLYLKGFGYRRCADSLNDSHIPTPSMIQHERDIRAGRFPRRQVAHAWSDGMVKDILNNDFYIGTLRLKKRSREVVHGKDKRVPRNEQYIFEHHHPAIIDSKTFELVQEIKAGRIRSNYRGSRKAQTDSAPPSPFGSCLFCKDCGSRLTPIIRKNTNSHRKYYICSKYNAKGKRYCPKAHLIEEQLLMQDLTVCLQLYRDSFHELIASYDTEDMAKEQKSFDESDKELQSELDNAKERLKILLSQKLRDLSVNPKNKDMITQSYDSLQQDILLHIHTLESELSARGEKPCTDWNRKKQSGTALTILDEILQKGSLDRKDIELLIEKITVDEYGQPEIELKYGLYSLIRKDSATDSAALSLHTPTGISACKP